MKKNFKIDYLSRDFSQIKANLESYVQRYYPESTSDMSQAGIVSMLIDSVAYSGDVLSYFLDYQTNESFLATAAENQNILNLAKSLGYKSVGSATSVGKATVFMLIPSDGYNSPDYTKTPIIKRGTILGDVSNSKKFIINEDIIIDQDLIGSNYTVARTNAIGNPTFYAVKFEVPIISGVITQNNYSVLSFKKFFQLQLGDPQAVEIISVVDSDGNQYYEVESLTQNYIFKSFVNKDSQDSNVKNILKPIAVERRFVFEINDGAPTLTFGGSSYSNSKDLTINPIAEPSKFILDKYNSEYLSSSPFEPSKLLNGDNYGIGPENTTLTIQYRRNFSSNSNALAGEVQNIFSLSYEFRTDILITETEKQTILSSIQVINEEAITGDAVVPTQDEIKNISGLFFQSQNRAVTAKDYEALAYRMPPKFGFIKKCKAVRDQSGLNKNLNLYVISVDNSNALIQANTKIKENLKNWLSDYKIVTDSIEIVDAKIINLKIIFTILGDPSLNKVNIKNAAIENLKNLFVKKAEIGESFNKLDIYRSLRFVNGVLDIQNLEIKNLSGAGYSTTVFNVEENTTDDGNMIIIPKNAIYEIKNLSTDIVGNVI